MKSIKFQKNLNYEIVDVVLKEHIFIKKIKFPLILMNSDILTKDDFISLVNFHKQYKNDLTICTKQYKLNILYGIIIERNKRVHSFVDKPDYKFKINAGIYVFSKNIFNELESSSLTDMDIFLKKLIKKNKKIKSYPLHEYWIDIGRIDDFRKAQIDISSGIF